MRTTTVLEYPATGATYKEEGMIGAYRYGSYGRDSVLAGQDRRELLGFYQTLFEAKKARPAWPICSGARQKKRPSDQPSLTSVRRPAIKQEDRLT